jgi:hypothetical protein
VLYIGTGGLYWSSGGLERLSIEVDESKVVGLGSVESETLTYAATEVLQFINSLYDEYAGATSN